MNEITDEKTLGRQAQVNKEGCVDMNERVRKFPLTFFIWFRSGTDKKAKNRGREIECWTTTRAYSIVSPKSGN